MNRFLSLFLVVIIIGCYSGFFRSTFAMKGPALVKTGTYMCHSMSTESNKTLTNINPDINAKIETISIDRAQLPLLNKDKIGFNKLSDNSAKEHYPPDLQISNSTFLL